MVFKFVILCASLAVANAGLTALSPVATYSSAPSVSYSSFSSPIHTNTISYAAAAPAALATHTTTYAAHSAHSAPIATTLHHAQPLAYSSAPAVATVYNSAYSHPAQSTIISSPAVGSTHQSTVRSFGGTVSHHSKAVDTAFSSVRQSDTRSSNNVYTPALAATNTLTYAAAAPAIHTATAYHAAPAAAIYAPKTLHYSSSPLVAHVSFDGLGTHYAF